MRIAKALLLSLPLVALSLADARDASACGGCLVQQTESTQVTGHKMILSVSPAQTTLWDQITYDGNPSSFAWVLPIKGEVEVDLSSDALFQTLDANTQVTVSSPIIQCPTPSCGNSAGASDNFGSGASGTGGGGEPPVTVISQEVVGPYETVQLKSDDPNALKNWLLSNDYNIPPDISPIIDAYVAEGFNFLALKLVPGQGVSAMRPVRVTMPGANPALPLRMVAAGTGAITPITLWVLGEGRYEPTNMPKFTIGADEIVWNWDESASNYAALKQQKFNSTDGKGWLIEAGEPFSSWTISDSLSWLVQSDPENSGYTGDMSKTPDEALQDDLFDLYGNIDPASLAITRLHGELSRKALAADLTLGASDDQSYLERFLIADQSIGTPPACPPPPDCGDPGFGFDDDGGGWGYFGGVSTNDKIGKSSCAFESPAGVSTAMSGLFVTAALAFVRRRRRRG